MYAELHCLSNFSFLRGASHPEELVARAAELGYGALALTDECSVAGVVRAHLKARELGIKLLIGAEFALADGPRIVLLAPGRGAYGDLAEIITVARRSAKKGKYRLMLADLSEHAARCLALWLPEEVSSKGFLESASGRADGSAGKRSLGSGFSGDGFASAPAPALTLPRARGRECEGDGEGVAGRGHFSIDRNTFECSHGPSCGNDGEGDAGSAHLEQLRALFPGRLWIASESSLNGADRERLAQLQALSAHYGVPLAAAGGVQMHRRDRKRLHDVLTAIRLGTTVAAAGFALAPNGERFLHSCAVLARRYPPALLAETMRIAERCTFSLDELRYEYPDEIVPAGETPASYLRRLTEEGVRRRWPQGVPEKVRGLIERELGLIAELNYEAYFLTVYDAVRYARERNIYCQGRGSAANSAVCYCLGITEVDPDRIQMLFERFISKERDEPPDIDVDFEHERREEVIQYIYAKYGRSRAALAATVITYRTRSAVRDVGKALGFSLEQVDRLAKNFQWWDGPPSPIDPAPADDLSADGSRPLAGEGMGGGEGTRVDPSQRSPSFPLPARTNTVLAPSSPSLLPEGEGSEPTPASRAPRSIGGGGELKRESYEIASANHPAHSESYYPASADQLPLSRRERARGEGDKAQERDGERERAHLPSSPSLLPEGEGGEPLRKSYEIASANHLAPSESYCPASADQLSLSLRERARGEGDKARERDGVRGARSVWSARLREAGFDPQNPRLRQLVELVGTLRGFPRHLSQHVGGFVIARDRLSRLVPIENAAMVDRTVIQWDKTDIEALGLLKVDCLGLGMLTVLHKAFDLIERHRGRRLAPASVPPEDPAVYEMIGHADTIGVFQIESRAQMSMLPRLRPKCFYDLVIEIAIVRPGPIQGNMVHPYLRRRQGKEPVSYPSEAVKAVLERTLGVPIFQEQVIKLAMVAAGFTGGEADGLRRAMAAWHRRGGLEPYECRLIDGMRANGYAEKFARQIFEQIKGFGEYGFPECVAGETRIVDADSGRWTTIEAIVKRESRVRHTLAFDENFRLRKRAIRAAVASGVKPVFRLRTALGHTIVATAKHPFFTMQGWRRLGELRPGDYLAAARSLPSLGRRRWPRYRIIVLAGLIAEGNLSHADTFYFYTAEPSYRDEFARAVERFTNTRAVVERHRSCFGLHVRRIDPVRASAAVAWMRELGLWGLGARDKHVPPEVFELQDADISLLLARMWGSGGGFSKNQRTSYDTASRRLAEEIQHLLLRLGIIARLYTRGRSDGGRDVERYVVAVTGAESLRQFWLRVGRHFLSPKKRRRSQALAGPTQARMSRDVVPAEVRTIIRQMRDARGLTWNEIGRMTGLSMREIQSSGGDKGGFRRSVIARLADCLRSPELERLAGSDFYWDQIVAIEPLGRRETYDLEIAGDHNFIANNLFVHNSHSASFALLAYVSAWLKRYDPAVFLAAILNSQPMGFYQPSQLVQDARRHGVEVRPVDAGTSDWDCTLEPVANGVGSNGSVRAGASAFFSERKEDRSSRESGGSADEVELAVRLGLRHVKGLSRAGAERLVTARLNAPFANVADLVRRAALDRRDRSALAASGALKNLAGHRYRARWAVAGIEPERPLLAHAPIPEAIPLLRAPTEAEDIVADYAHVGITLGRHPLALLRRRLTKRHSLPAKEIMRLPHGCAARTSGIVVCRQHPGSANGVIFLTLEDETGNTNVIVWSSVVERYRHPLLQASLLTVEGEVQREGEVLHIVAQRLVDDSFLLGELVTHSRDFR